jgi:hypothetical protein
MEGFDSEVVNFNDRIIAKKHIVKNVAGAMRNQANPIFG